MTTGDPERFFLAGVMGHPVLHSRSPRIHNYWLERAGLSGRYVPLDIEPTRLAGALRALPALGFSGCNLTIPHKEAAINLVDHVSEAAVAIGAINCVTVCRDGALTGVNNDGFGYTESVREAHPTWRAQTGPVVVLGAGGAARAIVHALAQSGAPEIRLANRTLARARHLAEHFGPPVRAVGWDQRAEALDGAAMLVNTTSSGMIGQPPLDIMLDRLPMAALVCDIVYVPRETALLRAARARGNRIVHGLGMLLHQARPAFEAWFGIMPEVTPELTALIEGTLAS